MNIYEFMSANPLLTFFIMVGIGVILSKILGCINIQRHGYPPEHCNANGDLTDEYNIDDEEEV